MLALMRQGARVSAADALALASVAVDLRVTQVVNGARACTPCSATTRFGPSRLERMGGGSDALRRAWEHDSAGREAEAVVEYRAAFEAGIDDEDLPGALLGFGSTLRNVGELEESERVLREAVTRFPDNAALRVFLALTRWERDDKGGAWRELVEALFRADAPGMARYERAIRGYSAEL